MKMFKLASIATATVILALPAHAVYVNNDPINLVDPLGQCSQTPNGEVGVCPTDGPSGEILDQTKAISPETAEADALAEAAGIRVPFTFNAEQTGGTFSGSMNPVTRQVTPTGVTVGSQGQPIQAVNTETGETIAYANGPVELTAHEVGGHVRDSLMEPRPTGNRDANTPNVEVGPIAAENGVRAALGVPVVRPNYTGIAPVGIGPNGVRPPKTLQDFLD